MIRLFETNRIRQVRELDGVWDFAVCSASGGKGKEFRLAVPGSWEMNPALCNYRGKGVYEREIVLERETNLRFNFYGVSHTADIYFDGNLVGHHYNAYTRFDVVIPHASAGTHRLAVEVTNAFGPESALHVVNDYYNYGGITRPVALELLPDVYIDLLQFMPRLEGGNWKASVRATLKNLAGAPWRGAFSLGVAGKNLTFSVTLNPGENMVEKELAFDGVDPWSAEHPKLYALEATLLEQGKPVDDLIDRVAFRQVQVSGRDLLVNGSKVRLHGFNRHEDHPMFGCAIPVPLMVQDLELIRATGANTIRTSHYPNDARFLDLCDEMGFYVWEESHARGMSEERMKNPNFVQQSQECINDMVRDHFNHPSIVLWGILNEGASGSPYGRTHYEMQFKQLKELDPSRPRTFASCCYFKDMCLDLVDVVSFNIYPLWYFDEEPGPYLAQIREWIEGAGGAGKPFIISEIGAGAIYGYRTPLKVKWSEERQAEILDAVMSAYLPLEDLTGFIIWQFCDCRIHEEDNRFNTRPKTQNNKGIVDVYRRPKLAYDVVRKHFSKS